MFSRTMRSSNLGGGNRGRDSPHDDPAYFMRDFQNIVGGMIGPGFRAGQPGRSGSDTLFPQGQFAGGPFMFGNGGNGRVTGGRMTFTATGGLRPRDPNGPQPAGPPVGDLATYASPPRRSPNGRSLYVISIRAPPDQLARILGGLFGPIDAGGDNDRGPAGMPPGLAGLFHALMNPANARSGDAVYTQEALDQIISQLMDQHPTSNAPGPASPDAIASLPKKNIDEKMLGPEGKAECSVCMDDVHLGDEVVALPCSHWFHETCASAWLSEHNTCPICRKGIDAQPTPPSNDRRSSQPGTPSPQNDSTYRFHSGSGRSGFARRESENPNTNRNEARLDFIRNASRYSPTEESSGPRRYQVVGDRSRTPTSQPDSDEFPTPMPGAFNRRTSDMSDTQRDSRRGNTSGSDRSARDSRRSSQSGGNGSGNGNGNGSGNGPVSWFRDRFGGNRRPE